MDKERLIEMAKDRGLEVAEESIESIGQLAIDIVSEVVKESENKIDDVVWASVEEKARLAVTKLDLNKDGI